MEIICVWYTEVRENFVEDWSTIIAYDIKNELKKMLII